MFRCRRIQVSAHLINPETWHPTPDAFSNCKTLNFFVENCAFCSMLELVVLGGELAVPCSRNPLMRGWIPSRGSYTWKNATHFDWAPRNKRSRTSSGPGGSSDKWHSLCRGPIPVISMPCKFHKDSTAGAQPFFLVFDASRVRLHAHFVHQLQTDWNLRCARTAPRFNKPCTRSKLEAKPLAYDRIKPCRRILDIVLMCITFQTAYLNM